MLVTKKEDYIYSHAELILRELKKCRAKRFLHTRYGSFTGRKHRQALQETGSKSPGWFYGTQSSVLSFCSRGNESNDREARQFIDTSQYLPQF